MQLPRACKRSTEATTVPTTPKYLAVENEGCRNLEHLEANNLQSIVWNGNRLGIRFAVKKTYFQMPVLIMNQSYLSKQKRFMFEGFYYRRCLVYFGFSKLATIAISSWKAVSFYFILNIFEENRLS